MKHLYRPASLCLILFIPWAEANAQAYATDRGSLIIDGQASHSSSGSSRTDYGNRITNLLINPSVQYFVVPQFAVGGDVFLNNIRYGRDDGSFTSVGIGPTVTYFFGEGERSYHPFLSATVDAKHAGSRGEESNDVWYTSYRGSGGITFMLSPSIGLTGEAYYQTVHTDRDNSVDTNSFGLAFGITVFLF